MRARMFMIAFAIVPVLVVGCTGGGAPSETASVISNGSMPADVLLLGTDHGPVTLSIATGSVLSEDADAIVSPDGSRLYSASSDGRSTLLETTDAATGDAVSEARIRGELAVRVVSGSGRAVALMAPLPDGLDPWTPVPRSQTRMVVADPTGAGETLRFVLDGNFEPEAFSTDDSRLFLIQYLPAEAPAAYRVTVLDLASGDVGSVYGRFKTPAQRMPGIRLRQEFDPNGSQLYTLYTNEAEAYANDYGANDYGAWGEAGEAVSFVHVLNLEGGWAYCVGLPKAFWGQPAEALALAVSPDSKSLYIVDSSQGRVAVMNTRTLRIRHTANVELGSLGGVRTSAQMSADGDTLFVGSVEDGSALYALDARTLDVVTRWPMEGDVSALGLSDDGGRLYVALGDRVALLDSATGKELAAVPFFGVESIVDVGTLGA
jgi:WD40 repeat protein